MVSLQSNKTLTKTVKETENSQNFHPLQTFDVWLVSPPISKQTTSFYLLSQTQFALEVAVCSFQTQPLGGRGFPNTTQNTATTYERTGSKSTKVPFMGDLSLFLKFSKHLTFRGLTIAGFEKVVKSWDSHADDLLWI